MKRLAWLLAAVCLGAAPSRADWTFYFFIAGDGAYQGPTYTSKGVKLRDQAFETDRRIRETALADTENRYVIFYDRKPVKPLSSGKAPRVLPARNTLRLYSRGRHLQTTHLRAASRQSSGPRMLKQIVAHATEVLPPETPDTRTLLFYYGEHLGVRQAAKPDQQALFQGLEAFGPRGVDLLLLQTCTMNSLNFLTEATRFAREVLVPVDGVLNSAWDWGSLLADPKAEAGEQAHLIQERLALAQAPIPLARFSAPAIRGLALSLAQVSDGVRLDDEPLPPEDSLRDPVQNYPLTAEAFLSLRDYLGWVQARLERPFAWTELEHLAERYPEISLVRIGVGMRLQ